MQETADRLRLTGTTLRVLPAGEVERLRKMQLRAVVDLQARARLTPERAALLDRVRRFRWWNAAAEFPEAPNEERQLAALINWFEGFLLLSAMLLAPGLAAGAVMLLVDRGEAMRPLGVSIALIALFLQMLLMQRLAYPLWGKAGDPGIGLRRAVVLLLAGPVLAALVTEVRHIAAVERSGLGLLVALGALHAMLLAQFLYHYLRYSGCRDAVRVVENGTPEEAVRAFYELLRPGGMPAERQERLAEAAQYMASFRTGRLAPAVEGETARRWMSSAEYHPQTLAEMGWRLTGLLEGLWVGDLDYDFEVAGTATLVGAGMGEVVVCCALRSKGTAGLSDGAEQVEDIVCRAHRLVGYDDGWYLDGLTSALDREDLQLVRRAMAWGAARAATR